jgi:hypothetical protein
MYDGIDFLFPIPDNARAERLRALALSMQQTINYKMNPSIGQQRATARRARIADSMYRDGEYLQKIQKVLLALSDAACAGTLPARFRFVKNRAQVEDLLRVKDPELMALVGSLELTPEQLREKQIKAAERDLIGAKIPGFFPTPTTIAEHMVSLARIKPGMTILEPSAGSGSIAAVISRLYYNDLALIEKWHSLRKLLELKGYALSGDNFLTHSCQYDRIIMNPPFENHQDIDHILHAYDCLKPDGRVVSIISESPFFRSDKKAVQFRKWLDEIGYDEEKLAPGAFYDSSRPTGVAARIIIIDKEEKSYE